MRVTPRGLRPEELFRHLPGYRVVICTTCHYAVLPKSVSRHLKEIHGVLGSARRPFLDWISTLDLAEPEDLLSLEHEEFAVEGLPVHAGLRCSSAGCGHLCLSKKRMKSHWVSVHGEMRHPDSENVSVADVLPRRPVEVLLSCNSA